MKNIRNEEMVSLLRKRDSRISYAICLSACCFAFVLNLIISQRLDAKAVLEQEVSDVVLNWLQETSYHLNEEMGGNIEKIALYRGGISGNIGYYLVILNKGWIILPADTDFWPVQTFGSGKISKESFEQTFWYHTTNFRTNNFEYLQKMKRSISKIKRSHSQLP
jgi:hypothetical protein